MVMQEEEAFQPVIQVWPGTIIDIDPGLVTIKLGRISQYETWEAYVKRCNQVISCAINLSARKEPEIPDFSDTTKFKQVGPGAYEVITPGYEEDEEKSSEL